MNISESKFLGLTDQIDFYLHLTISGNKLSKVQKEHCEELKRDIMVFGEEAKEWVMVVDELLSE